MKVNCFTVSKNGLCYDVLNHGVVLCSFSVKSLANKCALDFAHDFGGSVCLLR